MARKAIGIFLVVFLGMAFVPHTLKGQEVIVRSGFFLDSLRIGDQTGYFLAAEYPRNLNILFPDSTFDFSPFEFEGRRYFPTTTSQGKSHDSVVYYLSTFEIDRIPTLRLPVFQLNPMDCTVYLSPRDTILFTELVTDLPDSLTAQNLPLKETTAYQNVLYLFNYPVLVGIVMLLLVVSLVVWFIFGKRIRKHFIIKRMNKAHQKFLEGFTTHIENINQAFSTVTAENALSQWKKYMEQLESRPYTKLTTRETLHLENDESLGRNLHAIDGAIYGHETRVAESLENLKTFADQRFVKKIEEVKHG